MKITFLRHGPLLPPYDDYNKLSLDQLNDLALQNIDPSINKTIVRKRISSNVLLNEAFDIAYISPSVRTVETARIINQHTEIKNTEILDELKEIVFTPKNLVDKKRYKQSGLQAVREGLFEALENGSNTENLQDIVTRISRLENKIISTTHSSVLIITHGFLLRILQLYFKQPKKIINAKSLNEAVNYDYVSGFSVSIK